MKAFIEKLKSDDFGPKNYPFLPFWAQNFFSQILKTVTFIHLFNAFHQVEFQKNLMNRFKENLKNVNFGPKNTPFLYQNFSVKIKTITLNHF